MPEPVPQSCRDIDRVIYRGTMGAVGTFRCATSHPLFRDSGPIREHCVVFPRTAVAICHERGAPFQADTTLATVYRPGQHYQRRAIDTSGDRCDYFIPAPGLVSKMDPLFARAHIRTSPKVYLLQRAVVRTLQRTNAPDALEIDEALARVFDAMAQLAERLPERDMTSAQVRHRELVQRAQLVLAKRLGHCIDLPDIAAQVGCSVFHLCRVFRATTGQSLHEYRTELRLRASLDRLEAGMDITEIALDLGFSSHSHFSAVFGQRFGRAPRAWRR